MPLSTRTLLRKLVVIGNISIPLLLLLASHLSWALPSDGFVHLAQKPGQSDAKPPDAKPNLLSFPDNVRRGDGPPLKIEITYLAIDPALSLQLLTTADLPAAYARDATPLPAPEWLTASNALYVVSVGSFEDTKLGKRISQGFVKTNNRVRVRPRRFWSGIEDKVKASHFMDSVICIDRTTGKIDSFFSAKWPNLEDWYSQTDKFSDCIQTGPLFVEKGATTGFDSDAFDVGVDEYRKDGVRKSLWSNNLGVQNLVFYCRRVDGVPVLGIAVQKSERKPNMHMGLGDVAKLISKDEGGPKKLQCDRAIMLSHVDAGYFGPDDQKNPVGEKVGQSEMLLPTVFGIFWRR